MLQMRRWFEAIDVEKKMRKNFKMAHDTGKVMAIELKHLETIVPLDALFLSRKQVY